MAALILAAPAFATSIDAARGKETSRPSSAPNIVIILADDMGYGDPTCNVPTSKIPTPHIDALAKQGMRFTDAHTPSAVCTPTRYGLLTGRFAWRTILKSGVLGPYSAPLIEPHRLTLPQMLKQQGYATWCVGKWHLGMQWGTVRDDVELPRLWRRFDQSLIDLSKPITAGPLTAGFDSYFGTAVPNFPPYCFIENDRVYGKVPDRPKPGNMFGSPGLMQEGWDLHGILPGLKKRAVALIESHFEQNKDQPFFLYMPLTAPHTPIVPNEEYAGKSKSGDYGDLVCEVDAIVGAVMKSLEAAGVADNTLVLFTSDNGSPARAGDPHLRGRDWHQLKATIRKFNHNPNAPWRGMKGDIFEGGHRVPYVVRWPGHVPPGTTNDQLVGLIDTMRTIANLVDADLPEGAAPDAVDLTPTWLDSSVQVRQDLVHHSVKGMFAIRSGDWKLIDGVGAGGWTEVPKSPHQPNQQLYNLADDPQETKNLIEHHPKVAAELNARLEKIKAGR